MYTNRMVIGIKTNNRLATKENASGNWILKREKSSITNALLKKRKGRLTRKGDRNLRAVTPGFFVAPPPCSIKLSSDWESRGIYKDVFPKPMNRYCPLPIT